MKINKNIEGTQKNDTLINRNESGLTYMEGGPGNDTYINASSYGCTVIYDTKGNDTYIVEDLPNTFTSIGDENGTNKLQIGNMNGKNLLFLFDVTVDNDNPTNPFVDGIYITDKNSAFSFVSQIKRFITSGESYIPQSGGIEYYFGDQTWQTQVKNIYATDKNGVKYQFDLKSYANAVIPKIQKYLNDNGLYSIMDTLETANSTTINEILDIYKSVPINYTIIGTKSNNTLNGGNGNDTIKGGSGNDVLNGGKGNDKLYGEVGDDTIKGGSGNDTIYGNDGNDKLYGEVGNDTIKGGNGNDTIDGGDGNDKLYGEAGNDTIKGGAGSDKIIGGKGNDKIYTGSGNDTVYFNSGDGTDTLYKGSGTDTLKFSNFATRAKMKSGLKMSKSGNNLVIKYTSKDSVTLSNYFKSGVGTSVTTLMAKDGSTLNFADFYGSYIFNTYTGTKNKANKITGSSLNDLIKGNNKNDTLNGGSGNDKIYGYAGADTIKGGNGNDYIEGGDGNDKLYGEAGNDTIKGGKGDDIIYGNDGNDKLQGNAGNDKIKGGSGDDIIYGNDGNDKLYGEAGDDTLKGGAGNDTIYGNDGNDKLYSESGDNTLIGGTGNDELYSGTGIDTFKFSSGDGTDIVYNATSTDKLEFLGTVDSLVYTIDNNDLIISRTTGTVTDTVRIKDYFSSTDRIDSIKYNGVEKSILEDAMIEINGEGNITGSVLNDNITTSTNDDIINAGLGNNIINISGGNDTIISGSGTDTLVLPSGTTVTYVQNGNDLIIRYGESDSIILQDYFTDGVTHSVKNIVIGNNTLVVATEIEKYLIIEQENGTVVNQIDSGNYVFNATDNVVIQFTTEKELSFSRYSNNNDLIITYNDGETVTIKDYFLYPEQIIINGDTAANVADLIKNNLTTYVASNATDFTGTSYDDIIYTNVNDVTINGDGGNDTIYGSSGNDTIYGYANGTIYENDNDIIYGGDGDDIIDGNGGNDIICGGRGNDIIGGGFGADTVVFETGDGNDILTPNTDGVLDTIKFLDVDLADVTFVENGTDLILMYGNGDTITIKKKDGSISISDYTYQNLEGQDEHDKLILDEFKQGVKYITITESGTTTYGTSISDIITGTNGDDIIVANRGNDTINGGLGNNSYIFKIGDGNDIIKNGGGTDTLVFTNEELEYISAEYSNNDVILSYTGGTITLQNYLTNGHSVKYIQVGSTIISIESLLPYNIVVNDGSHYFGTEGKDKVLANVGNAEIITYGGDDEITITENPNDVYAGKGDDIINDYVSHNTYYLNSGDGNDIITSYGEYSTNMLVFGDENDISGVKFSKTSDGFILKYNNDKDSVKFVLSNAAYEEWTNTELWWESCNAGKINDDYFLITHKGLLNYYSDHAPQGWEETKYSGFFDTLTTTNNADYVENINARVIKTLDGDDIICCCGYDDPETNEYIPAEIYGGKGNDTFRVDGSKLYFEAGDGYDTVMTLYYENTYIFTDETSINGININKTNTGITINYNNNNDHIDLLRNDYGSPEGYIQIGDEIYGILGTYEGRNGNVPSNFVGTIWSNQNDIIDGVSDEADYPSTFIVGNGNDTIIFYPDDVFRTMTAYFNVTKEGNILGSELHIQIFKSNNNSCRLYKNYNIKDYFSKEGTTTFKYCNTQTLDMSNIDAVKAAVAGWLAGTEYSDVFEAISDPTNGNQNLITLLGSDYFGKFELV